ncbi:MAG: hypothetical protein ACXVC6_15105 [Bacteroidia bacterium]
MKQNLFLLLLCLCFAGFAQKQKPIRFTLNGSWTPVKQEMGGKELPKTVFEKQKLVMIDSSYTVKAESIDKGIARYKNGKMDIYGHDGVNKGKHFTAIYKQEKGFLYICYNLAGDSYPKNYESKDHPMFFLSVFKREVKK